jgi:hypothetical protein
VTRDEQIQAYIDFGWKLCAISPGSKGPLYAEWQLPGHEYRTPKAFPLAWGCGLLHAYSGTMALDIDHYPTAAAFLAEHGIDLNALLEAEDAVRIVSGRPNSAKLLYAMPVPRTSPSCAPYQVADPENPGKFKKKMALQFRCGTANGHTMQDALPPTMHPGAGRPYEWAFGHDPLAHWSGLPPLPAALDALWAELAGPAAKGVSGAPAPQAPPEAPRQALIDRYLADHNPGCDRQTWVKVGMVLHHEYAGSGEGFQAWQFWSAKAPEKYDDEAREKMWPMWRGFRDDRGYAATIEGWLRKQPAESMPPAEIPPAISAPLAEFDASALTLDAPIEQAADQYHRELMENRVHYLTAVELFYLTADPAHPHVLDRNAAGAHYTPRGLRDVLGPHMMDVPKGKGTIPGDPVEIFTHRTPRAWQRRVRNLGFKPTNDTSRYFEGPDGDYLNTYTKQAVEPIAPPYGALDPLKWLFDRIVDQNAREWVYWLFAYTLQNPGDRVYGAPLLFSETYGTGKTSLMLTLPRLLYGDRNVTVMPKERLAQRFSTSTFGNAWWVAFEEICAPGGRFDRKFVTDLIKPWITQSTIEIERKGVGAYSIPNYLQFTASTNESNALAIENADSERRWCVGSMVEQQFTEREMATLNPLFSPKELSPERERKRRGWLQYHFLRVDTSAFGFKPASIPPGTVAKARMADEGRDDATEYMLHMMDERQPPFNSDFVTVTDILPHLSRRGSKAVGPRAVIKMLRQAGAIEDRTDAKRFWIWANVGRWKLASYGEKAAYLSTGQWPANVIDPMDGLL